MGVEISFSSQPSSALKNQRLRSHISRRSTECSLAKNTPGLQAKIEPALRFFSVKTRGPHTRLGTAALCIKSNPVNTDSKGIIESVGLSV